MNNETLTEWELYVIGNYRNGANLVERMRSKAWKDELVASDEKPNGGSWNYFSP